MLSKKSKSEIWKDLKKRPLEDIEVIKTIEKFFLKKRGYIFKMPSPGENIILLLSGGADSIVLWDILMSKYKLNVYPLFVSEKKGFLKLIDHQYRSIKYFEKYYKKKNKKLFHSSFTISIGNNLKKEIAHSILKNPQELLNHMCEDGGINVRNYSTTSMFVSASLSYSKLLKIKKNIKIKTIFTGNLSTDGLLAQHQTLTALRSVMFDICNTSGDYTLQTASLFIEKELGYFFSKDFVVNWAKIHNIPLHKTWTCWNRTGLFPCGTCVTCRYRKEIMLKNKMKDTMYISDVKKMVLTIKHKVNKLILIIEK